MRQHRGLGLPEGWPFPLWIQGPGVGWHFSVAGNPYGSPTYGINKAVNAATRFGKRHAMLSGLGMGILGGGSLWFTMNPAMPSAQLVSSFLLGLGLQGCWLMVSSMTADICDLDELETGLQREGLYSSIVGLVQKLAFALIAVAGGVFLRLSGYIESAPPDAGTVLNMRLFLVGFIVGGLVLGFILVLRPDHPRACRSGPPGTRQKADRPLE